MFGCIDLIAIKGMDEGIFGYQVTSMANINAREIKSLTEPKLKLWLESGSRFFLHGWAKKGPKGKRKKWQLKEIELIIEKSGNILLRDTLKL